MTLTTVSFIDNLPITKTYEDLTVNSSNEIPIKFQVPPNLLSINIQVDTEVMNISKGKMEKLKSSHNIQMETKNYSLNFYDCHLRKVKGEYLFYVLGKNGEPLKYVNVALTLYHRYFQQNTADVTLTTDEEGKCTLGELKDILNINATFNGPNGVTSHFYEIDSLKEKVSLPGNLNILEDEEINLPFICGHEFSETTCSLIRYVESPITNPTNNRTLSNCFKKIKYTDGDGHQYGKINISELERGHYQLRYIITGQTISIRVHKGVFWESESFILKDHSLLEKRDTTNLIRIKNIKVEDEKENHNLEFTLSGFSKLEQARAHVFAYTFTPSNHKFMYDSIDRVTKDWGTMDIFPFAKWQNKYLSNRKLGDEFRYVFDRKFMTRFMGNTLDKPQLLLNRHKIRDTQFDQEVVSTGEAYKQEMEESKMQQQYAPISMMQQQIAPAALTSNMAPMQQQMNYNLLTQNVAPASTSLAMNSN